MSHNSAPTSERQTTGNFHFLTFSCHNCKSLPMVQPLQTETHRREKTGDEPFVNTTNLMGFDLRAFWKWSASDLVSNATRGILAEFIVAKALGVAHEVRQEWDTFDLRSPRGVPIEVKSCAYIQSWQQAKPSVISFVITKRRLYDVRTRSYSKESSRHANIYIFAVLAHSDRATLNPLDLGQWDFYPVLTQTLNERTRSQHSIGINSLKKISTRVGYQDLAQTVELLESRLEPRVPHLSAFR